MPFFLPLQCPQDDAVGALFLVPCRVLMWVLWGPCSLAPLPPALLSFSLAGLVCHLPILPYTAFVYQQIQAGLPVKQMTRKQVPDVYKSM